MPFPSLPTGWVPQQELSGLAAGVDPAVYATFTSGGENGAPPQHIVDYLASVGTPWDPARYSWNPMTGNLTDRASGASWDMRSVPNNSLGSYVVLPGGASRTAESGGTEVPNNILPGGGPAYYFEPGQGPTFFGNPAGEGQFFFSNDPAAIDAYQHDAQTRAWQSAAQIAALVGGAAALGGAGGAGAGTEAAAGGAGTAASTFPYAAGGPVTVSSIPGVTAGTAAGAGVAAGAAGGGGAATNALTGATAGFADKWLPYITGGINTLLGMDAAKDASAAEIAAMNAAIAEQRRQYDTTRADFMPWVTAGTNALNQLSDPKTNFMASPDYEFIRGEGTRGIENRFSARGGAQSGNALRALAEFNSNLAAGDFNNWWNRQAGLAGVGQNAVNSVSSAGQNTSANVSNYLTGQGVSRASGIVGRRAALAGGINDAMDEWRYRRAYGY